jgi:tight adherence protein C
MLILSSLIFVAVALGVAGVFLWMSPTRAEARLQVMAGAQEQSHWTETVVKVAGPLARLSTPEGDWENSPLRMKFLHAGVRNPNARLIYFGAKTLLPLLLAGLAFISLRGLDESNGLTLIFYVLLFALIGCYLPNLVLYLSIR